MTESPKSDRRSGVSGPMRVAFEAELSKLQQEMLRMGSMAEKLVAESVLSLERQDSDLAQRVIDADDEVDSMELEMENMCVRLLALQHPLAGDLRVVATVLKIATDLERLADYATNIAEITLAVGKAPFIKPLEDIPLMASMAEEMVRDGLDAFVARDVSKAKAVCLRDDDVDRIYSVVHDELMEFVTRKSDPALVEQAANLLFVARYLERIADHGTNIGERVIYMVTGRRESY